MRKNLQENGKGDWLFFFSDAHTARVDFLDLKLVLGVK